MSMKTADEAQNILRCTAVFLIECQPTFQRYMLPQHQGDIQLRTRQYFPEDSELHTRRRENFKSHKTSEHEVSHRAESCNEDTPSEMGVLAETGSK
jgi:hypothetical protein